MTSYVGIFLFCPGYDGGSLPKTLKDIEVSDTVYLDRWHIEFSTTDSGEQGDPVPYNIINNYFSIGVVSGMQHSYLQHIYILSATCIMLFSRVHSSNVRSYYGHQWDRGPLALICKCFLLFFLGGGDVPWPMDVPPPPPPSKEIHSYLCPYPCTKSTDMNVKPLSIVRSNVFKVPGRIHLGRIYVHFYWKLTLQNICLCESARLFKLAILYHTPTWSINCCLFFKELSMMSSL